jgi:hypothetical protein
MFRFLIIAADYAPSDSIAARRPESWARYFAREGNSQVDVVTLTPPSGFPREAPEDTPWPLVEPTEHGTIYRLLRTAVAPAANAAASAAAAVPVAEESSAPRASGLSAIGGAMGVMQALRTRLRHQPLLVKLGFLLRAASGRVDAYHNDPQHRKVGQFLQQHVQATRYDSILLTLGPFFLAEFVPALVRDADCPVVVDFRDSVSRSSLRTVQSLEPWVERVGAFLVTRNLQRCLAGAKFLTGVSRPVVEAVKFPGNRYIIHNGYEEGLFEELQAEPSELFEVTLLGTLYPAQDLDFMLEGFGRFLDRLGPQQARVRINFLGTQVFGQVADTIAAALPPEVVRVTPPLERQAALCLAKGSQVLYYPGWRGYRGVYSGKVFEYLALGRTILIAPSDHDVLDELIRETNSGACAETVSEMADLLYDWFEEWKVSGRLAYHGDARRIPQYRRDRQARRLHLALMAEGVCEPPESP